MPSQGMSLLETRVIDPVLTTMAQGYTQPELIGMYLMPFAEVTVYGGKIVEFDRAAFRTYNSIRSPGGATKRIQVGYEGKRPFALELDALESAVPDEQVGDSNSIGIDLQQFAMDACMSGLTLNLEVEQAQLLRNPANYATNNKIALSGTSRFNNAASKPGSVILEAKEAVRAQIGVFPNVMVIPAKTLPGLKENPSINDKIKYTSSESVTAEMLAGLYDFKKVVIGMAVEDDADENPGDVWGKDIIMSYVNPAALATGRLPYSAGNMANKYSPSMGYTYVMRGHPVAKPKYYDDNHEAHIFGAKLHRTPVLTGVNGSGLITSGFLIQNAVD